jgi:hypothetical protein
MHIGDRVRLLHGHEEGIITNILPNNIIEVEIEDGFVIPVLRKEVALVAKEESIHFAPDRETPGEAATKKTKEGVTGATGIYFSFIINNEHEVSLHLVNNTEYILLYSLSEMERGKFYGIAYGSLSERSAVKIKNYQMKDFESWPTFLVQLSFHRSGYFVPKQPMTKSLKLKAASFHKKKGKSPVLNKDGYIIQLDVEEKPLNLDPSVLKEKLLESTPVKSFDKTPPADVVDLHIEKLMANPAGMTSTEIMNVQLNAFRHALDKAIIAGMDQITFIHGVGNGVLKHAIQREASQMRNIRFFKDAMKEKFGYGATMIRIK